MNLPSFTLKIATLDFLGLPYSSKLISPQRLSVTEFWIIEPIDLDVFMMFNNGIN